MYVLDETLAMVLVMGVTGSKALDWKINLAKQFQDMRGALASKLNRRKGDELASTNKVLNMVLEAKRKEQGKKTDYHHYSRLAVAGNEAAFGIHEKGIRRSPQLTNADGVNLSKVLVAEVRHILNGVTELPDVKRRLRSLKLDEAAKQRIEDLHSQGLLTDEKNVPYAKRLT